MSRKPVRLGLSGEERWRLGGFMTATGRKSEYRRASAILEKANGLTYKAIADKYDVDVKMVQRWVEAYDTHGVDGLRDEPHLGKPSGYTEAQRRRIVELALQSPRLFGYLRNGWNVRLLARHLIKEQASG